MAFIVGRRAGIPMQTRLFSTAGRDKVSAALKEKFSDQVNRELAASQLYLSASLWCNNNDLVGMESFMLAESDEERSHASKLLEFAKKRKIPIKLDLLEAPPSNWSSILDLWEGLLEAEQENTQSLNDLANIADEERDHSIMQLLDPFHMEQVNSEDELRKIIAKVRDMEETPGLLRQLDESLAKIA